MSSLRAFSLVELSIVLVILGLLVGGILAGVSLMRASELRSVTADLTKYQAATMSFRDKYLGLPGDFPRATQFWPAADGADGLDQDCYEVSNALATCNGDGDGFIGNGSGPFDDEVMEMFRAWQHLAFAGMIDGSYTGTRSSGGYTSNRYTAGVNMPASKRGSGGFALYYRYNPTGISNQFPITSTNLIFGSYVDASSPDPILRAEDAWNIDKKLDDGTPANGRVRSFHNNTGGPDCVTSNTPSSAEYDLDNTNIGCSLIYRIL